MAFEDLQTWPDGCLDNPALQYKLKAYAEKRGKLNDSSLPELIALLNELVKQLNNLQQQITTGHEIVNEHINQTIPPAHTNEVIPYQFPYLRPGV